MGQTLTQWGIPPEAVDLADGSGLSRHNSITPQAMVRVLQTMARSPQGSIYRQSLAVAGESGSLRSRFTNTALVGRFQGKTGSMSGVYALAGYVQPPQFPPLVFSAFVNQSDQSYGTLRATLESVVVQLGRLQSCDP